MAFIGFVASKYLNTIVSKRIQIGDGFGRTIRALNSQLGPALESKQ
jgi:DNA-binding transcriptional regulator LsrR (DeoR family)